MCTSGSKGMCEEFLEAASLEERGSLKEGVSGSVFLRVILKERSSRSSLINMSNCLHY